MKKQYEEKYDLRNLVLHFYNILKSLDGVETQ
jgi:hypothetical protein